MIAPCMGCKDRDGGCHDRCSLYAEFKKSREKIRESRMADVEYKEYESGQVFKNWREKNR